MKGVGTALNSVDSMMALLGSVRKEVNELADYLVAEGVKLDKRIVQQARVEDDIAFAQIFGADATVAGQKVYGLMADSADRFIEAVNDLEKAAGELVKVAEAIKGVRAQRAGRVALQV